MYKMQSLEVSGAVRLIYKSLGVKGLNLQQLGDTGCTWEYNIKV